MDTLANMLIAIKNAGLVKKPSVMLPSSKMKVAVLELLKQEGFVKTYHVIDGPKSIVEVVLQYKEGEPRVTDVVQVSTPSRRVNAGGKEITAVKYGHGVAVLSTPKGILTDKQARKEMVGGELLFKIW